MTRQEAQLLLAEYSQLKRDVKCLQQQKQNAIDLANELGVKGKPTAIMNQLVSDIGLELAKAAKKLEDLV